MKILNNLIRGIIDLAYPENCLICKNKITPRVSTDRFVCAACWANIRINHPPFCHKCGRSLTRQESVKNLCVKCVKYPLAFDRAFSPCAYEGVIRELIHMFKYNSKDYLGPLLSGIMNDFIKEYNLPMRIFDAILPIPLHKTRQREREFNQSFILSQYISREFNIPVTEKLLLRTRNTRTQTELKDTDRFQNICESFAIDGRGHLKGKNLLLVDDVFTTGATCSEAARTLKQAGANIVYCITLAC